MKQILTGNLGWKVSSLLLAIALWIAVAREPELTTTVAVPIDFKGVPEDLDIGSAGPERVRLELRGASRRLSRENLGNLAVILDLSGDGPGERTYSVRASNINLPAGVSFYRAVPSQITLRLDKLQTRDVDVSLAPFLKGPPDGYRVRSYTLTPSKVRIRGPEQRVKNIARVTVDPVDLSGVVSQAEFRTHVNIGDAQVRLEAPSDVILKVILEKTIPKEKQ